LLSNPTSHSLPSGIDASLGFTEPCLLASKALMCFAGEGGGNGLLKILKGVELTLEGFEPGAGEFLKKLGKGLGLKNGNFDEGFVVWELGVGGGSETTTPFSSMNDEGSSPLPPTPLCEVSMGFPWQSPMRG
ncbi:hypothetical protein S245_071770, partial [Arachis hypogaea]